MFLGIGIWYSCLLYMIVVFLEYWILALWILLTFLSGAGYKILRKFVIVGHITLRTIAALKHVIEI
jgi:hypothetical protein